MSLLPGTVGGTAELLRPWLMSVKMCNITLTNARWRPLALLAPRPLMTAAILTVITTAAAARYTPYSMSLEGF